MPNINTVTGPMDTAKLGFTLPHEHLVDAGAGISDTYPELADREQTLEHAIGDLTRAKAAGIDTIVEVSTLDLGRDVKLMRQVSERTGMQFICATGAWLDIPRSFWGRTPDFIANLWSREIEQGIEGTDIKAGVIKVATEDPISDHEELMLRAAARTHHRTGVPITTHTPPVTSVGLEQIRILEEEGVDMKNVYIGHVNNTIDRDYHVAMMQKGAYLGWDINNSIGRPQLPSWEHRTDYLKTLLDDGYASRIMISQDWNVVLSRVTSPGFPTREQNPDGYIWNINHLIPRLKEAGTPEAVIHTMAVENPLRYFEGG